MPNDSAEMNSLSWKMWLLSEASDRLIRDVYVAGRIVLDYLKAKDEVDWSAVHQRGADRLLALCRVNRGAFAHREAVLAIPVQAGREKKTFW
jgi:hypothetical protein